MQWIALIIALALPQLAGALGSIFTIRNIPTWYARQKRPRLAPPNWVFGPVWTTLFVLMGVASYLVWISGAGKGTALTLYAIQLVLNVLWSVIFFGLRNPRAAFFELLIFWIAIAATIIAFWGISPLAGALMLPYLAWVSFAGYLNLRIWQLNA